MMRRNPDKKQTDNGTFSVMAGVLFAVLALSSCRAPLALGAAVLAHEAAHLLCAAFFGWGKPRVCIGLAGVRLCYDRLVRPSEEFFVCFAGPFVNIALAAGFYRFSTFSLYCFGLGVLNFLPISGLDGGGILRSLLSMFFSPNTVYCAAAAASVISVILLWALNIYVQLLAGVNVTLLAVSLYLTVTVLSSTA